MSERRNTGKKKTKRKMKVVVENYGSITDILEKTKRLKQKIMITISSTFFAPYSIHLTSLLALFFSSVTCAREARTSLQEQGRKRDLGKC